MCVCLRSRVCFHFQTHACVFRCMWLSLFAVRMLHGHSHRYQQACVNSLFVPHGMRKRSAVFFSFPFIFGRTIFSCARGKRFHFTPILCPRRLISHTHTRNTLFFLPPLPFRLVDQTKWVGDFPGGRQDFMDVCEVLYKAAMRGKVRAFPSFPPSSVCSPRLGKAADVPRTRTTLQMIADCPLPPDRLPKYDLLYKDI